MHNIETTHFMTACEPMPASVQQCIKTSSQYDATHAMWGLNGPMCMYVGIDLVLCQLRSPVALYCELGLRG